MTFRDMLLVGAIALAFTLVFSVEVHRLHQQLALAPVPMFEVTR